MQPNDLQLKSKGSSLYKKKIGNVNQEYNCLMHSASLGSLMQM